MLFYISLNIPFKLIVSDALRIQGRGQSIMFGGGLEPRAWRAREREPIWGSGGRAPSRVQGQSPWSGVQGGEAPLKLKTF